MLLKQECQGKSKTKSSRQKRASQLMEPKRVNAKRF